MFDQITIICETIGEEPKTLRLVDIASFNYEAFLKDVTKVEDEFRERVATGIVNIDIIGKKVES